jgi:hypothetical protein
MRTLIDEPLSMISTIKTIKQELFSSDESIRKTVKDCLQNDTIEALKSSISEFENVFRLSLVGPFAILAIFK